MKIPGYCIKCHRIKRVNCSASAFARGGGQAHGICDSCQQQEDDERRDRERNRQLSFADLYTRRTS